MEKELNYLSQKIEDMDHTIGLCDFGIELGHNTKEELNLLQEEKQLLENILNEITQVELNIK